jgi:hypothetical protein
VAARGHGADADGGAARLMRRPALALLLLAAVGIARAGEEPSPLGPCGPIDRPYDALEVPGAELRRLRRPPIVTTGLLAMRGGRAVAIPFQVDEREGRHIEFTAGPEPTEDDSPGILDGGDEVVFMACDAGERATPEAVAAAAPGARAWREIRITDPRNGRTAWAYFVVADAPPRTAKRYVAYDTEHDVVRTARYAVGMQNALPASMALVAHGEPGPNLLDGLRLRAEATLRTSLAHWKLDEQQGRHALVAWQIGPVRVARRSRHWVRLGLGLELSAGLAHTYFYARHVYGPGSMKLPFSPGLLFNDIHAFGGADLRDLRGWRFHADGTPAQGFRIDGHMEPAEQAFTSHGDWFALAGHPESLLFITQMSENLRRSIAIDVVYRDDATAAAPPEQVPGQVPLVGYEGRDVQKLHAGRYSFAIHFMTLDAWHAGDAEVVREQLAKPLVAEMTRAWPALPARER